MATHNPSPTESTHSDDLYLEALQIRNEQLIGELNFIKGSRGYRLLEWIKALPFTTLLIKLVKLIYPEEPPPPAPTKQNSQGINQPSSQASPVQNNKTESPTSSIDLTVNHKQSEIDQEWLNKLQATNLPLSINHPEWRGILSASSELFENILTIPDELNEERGFYHAELIKEAAPPSIIIQGFPLSYYHLVKALQIIAPKLPIFVIYHGNFLHSSEDYDWECIKLIAALYHEGAIKKVGFIKQGMAEVFRNVGINTYFLSNIVRMIPLGTSKPIEDNHTHIGIWAYPDWSWKKPPYAMLASLSMMKNSKGHTHNVSPRAQEFGDLLQINSTYHNDPLPRKAVLKKLAQMHLNLNISLTECSPMLPLESLSVGSPCLMGPTSHYFLDHEYLHSRLIVPYPDNAGVIAEYALRAIEERDEIIDAYIAYAPVYNKQTLDLLAQFLGSSLEG